MSHNFGKYTLGGLTGGLLLLAAAALAAQKDPVKNSDSDTLTVEGLVRDIACPIQNKKSTATDFSMDCILKCAKAGSPLGILTKDGTLYVPVTESMPDTGQQQLLPFVGRLVSATGKEFSRNGVHGLEIKDIHAIDTLK
jgi:hypothetical protein